METEMALARIDVFTTCPPSAGADSETYAQKVVEVSRWSEQHKCKGILVYTDNSLVDPWHVSQIIIENTKSLSPLVAIQPVYMHPYCVAKKITSLSFLYGRRIFLNMLAGGFKNDLLALNDTTPHDKRYARMVEYTTIIKQLLANSTPVTYQGEFYKVEKLRLTPPVAQGLLPGILLSGSSEAGLAAAGALGATAIRYPKPAREESAPSAATGSGKFGIRVGIIARKDEDEAWEIARERFPEERKGQIAHQLAMKTSDSAWHKQLSQMAGDVKDDKNPYWLVPFHNYKTFCPYLVGSYDHVAGELARYFGLGYRTVILDIPPCEEELHHTNIVFERALQNVA